MASIQNQQQAANFYSGFGLQPASETMQPATAPSTDGYYASPSTAAQVNSLYQGIYPIAGSAGAPTTEAQDFYNSTGISPAQASGIGDPLTGYVDQNGQQIVGNAASEAAATEANGGAGNDNLMSWWGAPGMPNWDAESDPNLQVASTDWSKANPGLSGMYGDYNPGVQPNGPPRRAFPMAAAAAGRPVGLAPSTLPMMGSTAKPSPQQLAAQIRAMPIAQQANYSPASVAALAAGRTAYTPSGTNALMPDTTGNGGLRNTYGDATFAANGAAGANDPGGASGSGHGGNIVTYRDGSTWAFSNDGSKVRIS